MATNNNQDSPEELYRWMENYRRNHIGFRLLDFISKVGYAAAGAMATYVLLAISYISHHPHTCMAIIR
jgi:hypothetical protein